MIKTILIDDHELVRTGIRQMLEDTKTIQIVGEASTGMDGINLIRNLHPHVAVLDFRLPDITGLEVTTKMLRLAPNLKILIVTSAINDLVPFRLLEAGAQGFLTKDATKDELIHTIKAINSGQRIISPEVASRLALSKISLKTDTSFSALSDREMEVMMLVIRGAQVKEISEKLYLSSKTVHSYRSRIFEKLNVNSCSPVRSGSQNLN